MTELERPLVGRAMLAESPRRRGAIVSKRLVEPFSDPCQVRAAFRWPRTTWILVLASAVPMYAVPLMLQAIQATGAWPSYWEIGQVSPGAILHGAWWLCEIAPCCVLLVLAAVIPRRLHAWWLGRLNLPLVEGTLAPAVSYRRPAERRFLVHVRGVRAVATAYYARLVAALVLLTPALVLAYGIALPTRSLGSVMSPSITFSSPEEYLPVFIAATVIVLLNAPTEARLLGPHAPAFRAGIAGGGRRGPDRRDVGPAPENLLDVTHSRGIPRRTGGRMLRRA